MPDGSERLIIATLGKSVRLDDRAVALLYATIKGERLRRNPILDRELNWLQEAVEVHEPNGRRLFRNTKQLIEVLCKIETRCRRGI